MRMDLHVHTTFSDGELLPQQVVEAASAAGLDAIALTDHDECRAMSALGQEPGIGVIAGIELAAQYGGEVHVLGLGIDWRNAALLEHVHKAAGARRVRASAMLDRLFRVGVVIEIAEVEAQCRGGVMGRPHIASALVKKGYAKNTREAFEKYLSVKTPYYVPQQRIGAAQASALIRQAGGLVVLAHPGLLGAGVMNLLWPHLAEMGFWGIEAYHPAHTDGHCLEYESMARQKGLFVTCGSDYHGSFTRVGIGGETRGGSYLQKSLYELKKCTMGLT